MKIVIGADHRGFVQKNSIIRALMQNNTIDCVDVGAANTERSDYPIYAHAAVRKLLDGTADAGILLCGNGVGMAMAANRYKGIYAGVAWTPDVARAMKEDDNVNVLVIPSDYVTDEELVPIVVAWLGATFKQGRYAERLRMVDAIE